MFEAWKLTFPFLRLQLLVDVTSHELRNPVSAILNNSKVRPTNHFF